MFESDVTALNNCAKEVFAGLATEKQRKLHLIIIDSPVKRAYEKGLEELSRIYGDLIPEEFILQMVEHTSSEVKTYISDKINKVINNLGDNNKNLFMYYVKTLLLTPNKNSKSKDKIYDVLPEFVLIHKDKYNEVEKYYLILVVPNVILDSERALVTLAKIRREMN